MAVPHAALGDDVISKMLDIAHVAFQDGDLQAIIMVNVDMQSRHGEIVVMVLG